MRSISELDLPALPMETAEFAADPYRFLAEARKKHPWLATCSFGYAVHQYRAIKDLMLLDDTLPPSYKPIVELLGARGTRWGDFQENHMLAYTGADHRRLRDILAPTFTSRKANEYRPIMRRTISAILDDWAPKGRFDFEEFASYFPINVMFQLVGAPPAEIAAVHDSLETLGLSASMDLELIPALQDAQVVIDDFAAKLVQDRRAGIRHHEHSDLLDDLLNVAGEGGLSDQELIYLLVFLFVAGYDSSKNMMTLIMNQLLDYPEYYERCANDVEYCKKVVEETLRFDSVGNVPRQAVEDIVYDDVLLPKGTMIFFTLSTSGRDPEAIVDPDTFNPDRDQNPRQMAFGRGMHICLGQFIARTQIEEGMHLIAQRIRNPKRAGPSGWRPFYGTWGMRGLPIEFDPESRRPEQQPAA